MRSKPLILDCLALLAGLLLPLAFAPFGIRLFALLSPALSLFIANHSGQRRAFYRGWLYGLGQFGLGVSWVYVSMAAYGGFGAPLALLLTCLTVVALALFPALQIYLLQRFYPKNNATKYLSVFPATWVLTDYLRGVIASGFPWLLLGYTQINTPLRNLAPLVGVYGLSFAVCYTAAGGLILLSPQFSSRRLKSLVLCSILVLWVSATLLSSLQWTQAGPAKKISLVQGNILQELKWEPTQLPSILKTYRQLTEQHWDSALIVWPEAAIPALANAVPTYLQSLSQQAVRHRAGLLIGAPLYRENHFYNAIITAGDASGVYLKHHLVPFGEYLPLKRYLQGLFNWLRIPMSDFSPGPRSKEQALLVSQQMPIAAFICYEIAYPSQVLEATAAGAQLLVVVTDDSWFGHSFAAKQHLEMAQMRALETGKYLLFSSNTGITAVIKPDGRLLSALPDFQQGVLTASIHPMLGRTPLTYIGNRAIVLLCLALLVLVYWRTRFNSRL